MSNKIFYGVVLFLFVCTIVSIFAWTPRLPKEDESLGYEISAEEANNLAVVAIHSGKYDRGFELLALALELNVDNPLIFYNVSNIYLTYFPEVMQRLNLSRGEVYEAALAYSLKATALAPDNYIYASDYALNLMIAEAFELESRYAESVPAWQHARTTTNKPMEIFYTLMYEARCHMFLGNDKEAQDLLNQAQRIVPDSDLIPRLLEKLDVVAYSIWLC